jgi:hypothetical protein
MRNIILLLMLFFAVFLTAQCEPEPGAPTGLICELLRAPERAVITDPQPEFGWIVNDTRRGAMQSAWQILVSSSQDLLDQDNGDMWDSGKKISNQSIDLEYQGKNLKPDSEYWWKVRTFDGFNRVGPYSEAQKFQTGRLEWMPLESKWITRGVSEWLLENRQRADYDEIAPERLIRMAEGHYFADFGKAAFATLQLTVSTEKARDSLIIYLGERKTADNRVDRNIGRSNIGLIISSLPLKKGKNTYTLQIQRKKSQYPNSQILAEHMPEVTPFRYAEIINSPSEIFKGNIKQIALFYYFDENASYFKSSNQNLNQVWDLCKYTMKMTPFLALYTDGNRERMPYEADSYIQQLGHYAVDREYSVARYTLQFLLRNPSWPTECHMHMVFIAWHDYMQTGNIELLQKYYIDLKAKTLSALARADGLISTLEGGVTKEFLESLYYRGNSFSDLVDWPRGKQPGKKQASNQGPTPEGERDGYIFMPYNTVVNAFHYRTLVLMADVAKTLGESEEVARFSEQAARVKESFNKEFFETERGIYLDGIGTNHASLHANMYPLAFGLVPSEKIPSVLKYIKSRGMACSVYGAQSLLEALYNTDESEYALSLMTAESKRSWMNMIRAGSTVTTEAWDEYYKPNLTWNHSWGAAPANIIPRRLMGIQPLEPAFRLIEIKPQPGDLTNVEMKMPTIRGPVFVKWTKEGDEFNFKITIPANTRARVWLPSLAADTFKENGKKINECKDIIPVGRDEAFTGFEIGAGEYFFSGQIKN